jgi:hypothetical protein
MRIALVLAAALALPASADGGAIGAVDWQKSVVRCTGLAAANLREANGNAAVARIGAERAAKLDALRNCLETVKGAQLDAERTVGGALAGDRALAAEVEGVVRGFRVVGKPRYYSDGGVEIDVEVPLQGNLSDLLLPRPGAEAPRALAASDAPAPGTSLVVDARGQKLVPALAPRVLDEAGNELYGPAVLSPEARRSGAAAYARDLASAKLELASRVGDAPLVVKALRASGPDVVISSADAARLAGKNVAFLAEGRVVFLAD